MTRQQRRFAGRPGQTGTAGDEGSDWDASFGGELSRIVLFWSLTEEGGTSGRSGGGGGGDARGGGERGGGGGGSYGGSGGGEAMSSSSMPSPATSGLTLPPKPTDPFNTGERAGPALAVAVVDAA